jgi:hypothetical protein
MNSLAKFSIASRDGVQTPVLVIGQWVKSIKANALEATGSSPTVLGKYTRGRYTIGQ